MIPETTSPKHGKYPKCKTKNHNHNNKTLVKIGENVGPARAEKKEERMGES